MAKCVINHPRNWLVKHDASVENRFDLKGKREKVLSGLTFQADAGCIRVAHSNRLQLAKLLEAF